MKFLNAFLSSTLLLGTLGIGLSQTVMANTQFTWSVQNAKEYAFQNAPLKQDITNIPAEDPYHFGLNRTLVKKSHPAATVFKHGEGYIIEYPDDTLLDYTYHGALRRVTFRENQDFPKRAYTYSYPYGQLERITLLIGPKEMYEFQANGQHLIMHCINNRCFNPEGLLLDNPFEIL